MTWWPSGPPSAVIAPTIAGSSSTTRMRSWRAIARPASDRCRGRERDHESRAMPVRRLAPQPRAERLREPPRRVQPDARPARRVRVAARIGLEDSLAPLLRDAGALVRDAYADRPVGHLPVEADGRVGWGVLDRVLDEVLEDLAEAARGRQGEEANAPAQLEAMARKQRRQLRRRFADDLADVRRLEVRGSLRAD